MSHKKKQTTKNICKNNLDIQKQRIERNFYLKIRQRDVMIRRNWSELDTSRPQAVL